MNKTITIWKGGLWKVWSELDAYYARNDPDWVAEISVNELMESLSV